MNKKIYRSSTDKKFFGVCGGLYDYTDIDSSFFRIIFIVTSITGTIGIWVYLIMAMVLKYNPDYTVNNYTERKKLYRSKKEAKLFGVCQGLADYFDVDVTALRILFVFLSLAGLGILFYISAGIVVPVDENN